MTKAIVFDFFGVLSPEAYWPWMKQNVQDFSQHVEEFKDLSWQLDKGDITYAELLEQMSHYSDEKSPQEIHAEMRALIQIDAEVLDIVQKLKKQYKTGLLTNTHEDLIHPVLEEVDLYPFFNTVVVSSEAGYAKPEEEIFSIALNRLEVDASEAMFIDDRKRNAKGAEGVGMDALVYQNPDQLRSNLKKRKIL